MFEKSSYVLIIIEHPAAPGRPRVVGEAVFGRGCGDQQQGEGEEDKMETNVSVFLLRL